MRKRRSAKKPLPDDPPDLAMRHSAAVTVLAKMGFQGEVADETFRGYIKGLRRLGIPFSLGATRRPGVWLALYGYEHLMELAVALSLRAYNILPDSLVEHLIERRDALTPLYVQAWRQCARNPQPHAIFRGRGGVAQVPAGPYLDLQIVQHGRGFGMSGSPRLISTAEALELYGSSVATAFLPGPVRIAGLVQLMARSLGHPPPGRTRSPLEPHTAWVLETIGKEPQLTLADLEQRFAKELGLETSQRSLRRFVDRHGIILRSARARRRSSAASDSDGVDETGDAGDHSDRGDGVPLKPPTG